MRKITYYSPAVLLSLSEITKHATNPSFFHSISQAFIKLRFRTNLIHHKSFLALSKLKFASWLNISDSRHGNEYCRLSLQGIVLYVGGNKYYGLSLRGIVL